MSVDEAKRICRVTLETDEGKSKKPLGIPEFKNDGDVLNNLMSLKVKYDEEIMKTKTDKAFLDLGDKNPSGLSSECYFNGKLKKEIRGNLDSFYICRCFLGFLGDNCQIRKDLYQHIQSQLIQIMDQIQTKFINHDKHSQTILFKSLIMINKFKIGRPVLEKMIFLISSTLEHNKEMDNRKQLYVLYDAILLNLFDILEDIKKHRSYYQLADTESQKEHTAIYQCVHNVIKLVEDSLEDLVYAESFLEKFAEKYIAFDTYSYTMAEYKYKNLKDRDFFRVRNPNIDTSFNIEEYNTINFEFNPNVDISENKNNIQILNFAAPLFRNKAEELNDVLITNLIYLKNIDPKNSHKIVENVEIGLKKIQIRFALLFLPSYEDIKSVSYCKANAYNQKSRTKRGKLIEFNEEEMTMTCEFVSFYEFKNYYFAVTINK